MNDRETVIVDGLRTPFGRMGGALAQLSAVKLATPLIKEIVERNKIKPDSIDEVIVGQVVLAGCGQIPSRQALLAAGLPNTTESTTVNKVCASGMRAVTLADLRIRANDADIIVAGGMESMSQAPYIVEANSARFGKRMGHVAFQDAMLVDGLECPVTGVHMAVHGAKVAEEFSIGREEQDEWAVRSHKKAVEAQEKGAFKKEILAVEVRPAKGRPSWSIRTNRPVPIPVRKLWPN